MSLRPAFLEDSWDEMINPYPLFCRRHFGFIPHDCIPHPVAPLPPTGFCALCHQREQSNVPNEENGISEVENNDTEFRVRLDMQYFNPGEIEVKVRNNRLIIHGQHEERPDEYGYISRQFTRQYVLPKSVDPSTITSWLGRDGMLIVRAPKKALEPSSERIIPITQETEEIESSRTIQSATEKPIDA